MRCYDTGIKLLQIYRIQNNIFNTIKFFGELDKYVPKQVFELLTGTSQEERVYIIKTVCRWLRTGGDISDSYMEIIESVRNIYPELSWYMETPEDIYGSYSNYFTW